MSANTFKAKSDNLVVFDIEVISCSYSAEFSDDTSIKIGKTKENLNIF